MGEKVGAFGINWGEIALRSVMTIVTSMLACLFLFIMLDVFGDSKRYGWMIFMAALAGGAFLSVWVRMIPVVRIMARRPKITVYEQGMTVRERSRETDYMWPALTRWTVEQPFTFETYQFMMIRSGHVVFYQGDEAVLHVTRLIFNGPKLADLIIQRFERLQAQRLAEVEAAKWPAKGDDEEFYEDYDDDLDPAP